MLFEPSAQLDIFDDSRDVMLRNDVLQALQVQDAPLACTAYAKWGYEYPQDPLLADAGVLLRALQARADLPAA